MANNEPTASAIRWQITSGGSTPAVYELACYANQIFGSEVGFKTVYRSPNGEWKWLIEPSIFDNDNFDEVSNTALERISRKVREFFLLDGEQPPIPDTLYERVEQLLRTGVEWSNNNLTKKQV